MLAFEKARAARRGGSGTTRAGPASSLRLCPHVPLPRRSHLPDRGPRRRTGFRLALGLLTALTHAPAHADWDVDASVGAFYDDNLTRAANAADKRAAGAATLSVNATNFAAVTGSDGITYTLYGRAELFDRYSGLTNLTVGGIAVYRHKFGVGNLAPWVAFSGGASYDDFREICAPAAVWTFAPRPETGSPSS
jgi:hypothetical protein